MSFSFTVALHGFHIYREVWKRNEKEELVCTFEEGNSFDMFPVEIIHLLCVVYYLQSCFSYYLKIKLC